MRNLGAALLVAVFVATASAQNKSWVGETIIVKMPGMKLTRVIQQNERFEVAELWGVNYIVLAEGIGQIKIKDGHGNDGWLDKSDVVLLKDAVGFFSERIRQNPDDSDAYTRRASASKLKGDLDSAIKDFSEAVRLNPQCSSYSNRGTAWEAKKDYAKAIADYNQAIQLDPKNALSYYNRGAAWSAKKDHDKAIADYSEAIQCNPKLAAAYFNRGTSWSRLQKHDRAIADFDQAIQLDPGSAEYYCNRGISWCTKKDYDKAIADADAAIRLDPRKAAYYVNRGVPWAEKKVFNKAMADQDEAIRLDPKCSRAYYNKACFNALLGRTDPALENLRKSLELGYDEFSHMEKDTDLNSIRNEPRYKKLVDEFQRRTPMAN